MQTIENKDNNISEYAALITFFMVCFYCIAYISRMSGFNHLFTNPEIVHISIISLMTLLMVLSVYGREGLTPPIWMACALFCAIIWGLFLYFTGLADLINKNTARIVFFVITLFILLKLRTKVKAITIQKPMAVKVTIICFWALYFINPLHISIQSSGLFFSN